MKYAIQISDGPTQSSSARTAYQFIRAALEAGHEIVRVFFYSEGIYNAFALSLPGDEWSCPDWSGLARRHGVELVFCSTAAERRGMLRSSGAYGGDLSPVEGFRAGGLGLWMDACLSADRVIQFGG
jgi:tRNA 2-thiouridine synthesizing protein D